MEKIPFRESGAVLSDLFEPGWRSDLPTLSTDTVTLRELRTSDAPMLFAMLATEEVGRFIPQPPSTVEGFEQCVAWTHRERAAGRQFCYGVVPNGMDDAVGFFLVRQMEPDFATAEWRFALGSPYWGTGVFVDSARLVMDFSFGTVGVHRIEARTPVKNGRGNGALRKIGSAQEGVLRRSFQLNGEFLDQVLWAVIDTDSH
jgi:[ribosomal protein S5]-alanine N-acetyltransferase